MPNALRRTAPASHHTDTQHSPLLSFSARWVSHAMYIRQRALSACGMKACWKREGKGREVFFFVFLFYRRCGLATLTERAEF